MNIRDSLQLLNLPVEHSEKDLTAAYRKMARKYHPDVNKEDGATEKFKEVQQAYEILKNKDIYNPLTPFDDILNDLFSSIRHSSIFSYNFTETKNGSAIVQLELGDFSESNLEKMRQILEKEGIKVKSYSVVRGYRNARR